MKKIKMLFAAVPFLISMGSMGCGSSTTPAPTPPTAFTIESLEDSDGNTIDTTGSTIVAESGLVTTFSVAANATTVDTDSLTLACTGQSSIAGAVSAVSSENLGFTFLSTNQRLRFIKNTDEHKLQRSL
jgi:hypothetical protein